MVDVVGGDFSEAAMRSLAFGGRLLVIGFAAGRIPSLPLNLLLLKGSSAVGVFWGRFCAEQPEQHFQNSQRLLEWVRQGVLQPLVEERRLEDAARTLEDMQARRIVGKVALLTAVGRRSQPCSQVHISARL